MTVRPPTACGMQTCGLLFGPDYATVPNELARCLLCFYEFQKTGNLIGFDSVAQNHLQRTGIVAQTNGLIGRGASFPNTNSQLSKYVPSWPEFTALGFARGGSGTVLAETAVGGVGYRWRVYMNQARDRAMGFFDDPLVSFGDVTGVVVGDDGNVYFGTSGDLLQLNLFNFWNTPAAWAVDSAIGAVGFAQPASLSGYIVYPQTSGTTAYQHDEAQPFGSGWASFDLSGLGALATVYKKALTVGGTVYLAPNNSGGAESMARFNGGDFTLGGNWEHYDLTAVNASWRGFNSAQESAGYVYFVPGAGLGRYLARHTSAGALNTGWTAFDLQVLNMNGPFYGSAKTVRPNGLTWTAETQGPVPGTTLDGADGVAISGNYAYVAAFQNNSLVVIDISDPSNPTFVAETQGPVPGTSLGGANGIEISGNYAYVACGIRDSLAVVDITDPNNPTFIADTRGPVPGTSLDAAYGLTIDGNYVYVACRGRNSLAVIDVTNPAVPTFVAETQGTVPGTTLNTAYDVDVSGNYAYVACFGRASLAVIDISNPAVPTFVAETRGTLPGTTFNEASTVVIDGSYAYMTCRARDSLAVIDISNPAVPTFVAETRGPVPGTTLNGAFGLAIGGNYAYVSCGIRDSLAVIDISSPSAPTFIGEERGPVPGTSLAVARDVALSGNYAYVATFDRDSLAVIELAGENLIMAGVDKFVQANLSYELGLVGAYQKVSGIFGGVTWGGEGTVSGGYVYFGSTNSAKVARYDTAMGFTDPAAWDIFDTSVVFDGLADGFSGSAELPGEIIFAGSTGKFFARYDNTMAFTDPAAWSVFNPEKPHVEIRKAIGQWGMIGAQYNGADFTLFCENLWAQLPATLPAQAVTNLLSVGTDGEFPFNSVADQVGLWDCVLTLEQVSAYYNSGNGRSFAEISRRTAG